MVHTSRHERTTAATYDELLVRSETGIGSEGGPEPRKRRFERTTEPSRVSN